MIFTAENDPENNYPIGVPGKAWGDEEKSLWRSAQQIRRSYLKEVISKLNDMQQNDVFNQLFSLTSYGALPYDTDRYPLYAIKTKSWDRKNPNILVTGGVHGYETSGVQGAIRFAQSQVHRYTAHFNFIILPCISPWGYETINRWDPLALDPNRSFFDGSPAPESALAMGFIKDLHIDLVAHFDLHETTDTDNSEFRPALAARDGVEHEQWDIPDGFYAVGDISNPEPNFQKAVIASVEEITHIAPCDAGNRLIGVPIEQHGVINYDKRKLNLCGGFAGGKYLTTTEVYPDSAKVDDENCILAQVAAITGGLDYIIAKGKN